MKSSFLISLSFLCLVGLLSSAGAKGGGEETLGQSEYEKARVAFYQGNDENAARFMLEALNNGHPCISKLREERFERRLPRTPCGERTEEREKTIDAGEVLYRMAMIKKTMTASGDPERGKLAVRTAGVYFLEKAVSEFPKSLYADNAALALQRSGFCLSDAGYPGCIEWEIESYRDWLAAYPRSELRPETLRELAVLYLELADRYESEGPWRSVIKGELLRGRAIEVAGLLARDYPGTEHSVWAHDTIREIKHGEKPYSMMTLEYRGGE